MNTSELTGFFGRTLSAEPLSWFLGDKYSLFGVPDLTSENVGKISALDKTIAFLPSFEEIVSDVNQHLIWLRPGSLHYLFCAVLDDSLGLQTRHLSLNNQHLYLKQLLTVCPTLLISQAIHTLDYSVYLFIHAYTINHHPHFVLLFKL